MGRILVVDAEGSLLEGLRGSPLLEGQELETASGHVDALQRLRRRSFDVVVTDPSVPVDEDFAFLEEVRAARPGVRVIVLSPGAAPEALIAALRSQVFATFAGPLDLDEVAEMVVRAAGSPGGETGIEVVSARPDWISLRVNCGLVTVERLVRFLSDLGHDLPAADRDRLLLGVREILLNAMEHGAGFDPEKVITVTAIRTGRAIVYYFRDPGSGFTRAELDRSALSNPEADPMAHLERRAGQGLRPGGFGILVTRKIVDEMYYNERGNEALLIKRLD